MLELLAFSSPAYFEKVFRQQTGMTPKAYRKAQKCNSQERSLG